MRLYVGNLSYSTKDADLREVFGEYGELASVAVITDRDTGRSKGFGFVEFANDDDAKAAMEDLNGKEVGGRVLKINEARPREEGGGGARPRRPGGSGGGYR
jgi:RNA recognition motif-containing protein